MANRKLKNFEFANHSEKGNAKNTNTDELTYFDCVNGNVFILCQDSSDHTLEVSPAALASERLKYYLENEFVENPTAALRNALIYTNGFIFEYGRKNPGYEHAYVHCACVLIRDNKVFYATLGELSVFYFNGKRPVLVSRGEVVESDDEQQPSGGESEKSGNLVLLGKNRDIEPMVNAEPLVPVNDDMLLMCSKGFYESVVEKSIQKILTDPMPVQTKVYRFVDMASIASGDENISLQLISFYNLDHTERKFVPLILKKSRATKKKFPAKDKEHNEEQKPSLLNEYRERLQDSPVKYVLVAIAVLLIAYMFYDLFIRDPMPPVRRTADTVVAADDSTAAEVITPEEEVANPSSAQIPDDAVYTVKSGDNWSRIYSQYGVCSWFIRNHPLNEGKFDSEDNPVAGSRIYIPLLYSAKAEHNPEFYREFSLEKTGSRCENANQDFIDAFESENL